MSYSTNQRAVVAHATTRLLDQLGGSLNAVANNLEDAGVQGVPGDNRNCAIARYLNAVMAGDRMVRRVSVSNTHVRIRAARFSRAVSVSLPDPVRRFIHSFDRRAFPQLSLEQKRWTADGNGRRAGDATPVSGHGAPAN